MAKLKYKLTRDTLFRVFFVKCPDLLKSLVTQALGININDVKDFRITNTKIPGEVVGEKFCELDIKMELDGETVSLEVQVDDEDDFPERSLYYWARCYSSELHTSEEYIKLPRTIAINIVAFNLFKDTKDFHSEFRALEVTRHTELTDKMSMHYFELKKLPKVTESDAGNILKLWLAFFNAETEEEMLKIAKIGGEIMEQAVQGYKSALVSKDFEELERLREKAKNNERAALGRARREKSMEIAKTLKTEGVSIDIIQKSTGLDIDVIQKI
jgi:predicted transposase/invertase (TIGR01784 family)